MWHWAGWVPPNFTSTGLRRRRGGGLRLHGPDLTRSPGRNRPGRNAAKDVANWYAFTVGAVRVLSLNNDDVCLQDGGFSGFRRDNVPGYQANDDNPYVSGYSHGQQRAWLERELAAASRDQRIDWIVVCMHQVAMSSAHFNGADLGIRQQFLPLFDRYGVDLVVAGHEHHFERTFPVRHLARHRPADTRAAGQRRSRDGHQRRRRPHDHRRRRALYADAAGRLRHAARWSADHRRGPGESAGPARQHHDHGARGGPGLGCGTGSRRSFDPERYRIILFDQRGCGRSTSHASDPAADIGHNTTGHLLADMEQIREQLGVERWLLFGGSWGSALTLAYAERHPDRVSEIVIANVTSARRWEYDWLYRGVGRFFPADLDRFQAGVPEAGPDTEAVAAVYALRMENPDPVVRAKAAADWCAWEDAILSLEPSGEPDPFGDRPADAKLALVRICAHYAAHGAWLEKGVLLREAGRLAGIPGVLIHGRLDLSSPLDTAWEFARAWPDAQLVVVDDSGHKGSAAMHAAVYAAFDRFAHR
jgi:proline iminopeptidase